VFFDMEAIRPGDDFIDVLRAQVEKSTIMLVIIGEHWLDSSDDDGRSRLENNRDFVRLEIEAALSRNIPVIPILLDNAPFPSETALPESLLPLMRRRAFRLLREKFDTDAAALIDWIKTSTAPARIPNQSTHFASADQVLIQINSGSTRKTIAIAPGGGKTQFFQDLSEGPQMIVVPSGIFLMGSPQGVGDAQERPRHSVTIARPFAVSRYAITVGEFRQFVAATDYRFKRAVSNFECNSR